VTIEFDPKANMEFITLALREELAKTQRVLPVGVRPVVVPYVPDEFRPKEFLSYTISGPFPLQRMREILKDKLEFGIGSVKAVSQVTIIGLRSARSAFSSIKRSSRTSTSSHISSSPGSASGWRPTRRDMSAGSQEYLFKFTDKITDIKEIDDTLVMHSGRNPIYVKDVADVSLVTADVTSIHRINGQPTVSVSVLKEPGTSSLKVAKAVKAKLEEIKRDLPSDLVFKTVNDESEDIGKNLRYLYQLAAVIIVIVFLMVFAILRRITPSLLILSSIAFSIVITFNLIYVFKISMNMLTLGALAMGFGMLVDNAIVVFENSLRLREQGLTPREAAIRGAREVFIAVLASTLTTCAVFELPFFQGKLKMYYLPVASSSSLAPGLAPRLVHSNPGPQPRDPGKGRFKAPSSGRPPIRPFSGFLPQAPGRGPPDRRGAPLRQLQMVQVRSHDRDLDPLVSAAIAQCFDHDARRDRYRKDGRDD
jgi:HAE1 family hydrophobic/amphiphilic exporter-1